jgi:site-specific DNA-methyltransferase (adenine-specific)
MEPAISVGGARVFAGDCREVLKALPDNSVDSIVTDPPYELGFMGKKWDNSGIAYDVTVWAECLRVLKPGGHILAFGGSRTYHRLGVAIEDAGFEIRDTIAWISSKTFPKSLNVEKAMNKGGMDGSVASGWGTGLKQVVEPVVMARKALEGTVAQNFDRWGVGGINIDGSRITTSDTTGRPKYQSKGWKNTSGMTGSTNDDWKKGRWPANVILDEVTAGLLDAQSGERPGFSGGGNKNAGFRREYVGGESSGVDLDVQHYGDTGGASRFFYVAKASKRDRNEGLEHLEDLRGGPERMNNSDGRKAEIGEADRLPVTKNHHPTVKPTQLMRYLVKLVTPPGGTVLDPFTGSGSTGKAALLDGFQFVGIELTEEYLPIIEGRLRWANEKVDEDDTLF